MSIPFADLGTPILAAFGAPVTLQRRAAGSYVNGLWVAGALTSSTLNAVVQPAGPRDLQKLPEGERTEETVAIFTVLPLVASNPPSTESDRVVWQGRTYRVRLVEDWNPQALYAYALAVRVTP